MGEFFSSVFSAVAPFAEPGRFWAGLAILAIGAVIARSPRTRSTGTVIGYFIAAVGIISVLWSIYAVPVAFTNGIILIAVFVLSLMMIVKNTPWYLTVLGIILLVVCVSVVFVSYGEDSLLRSIFTSFGDTLTRTAEVLTPSRP